MFYAIEYFTGVPSCKNIPTRPESAAITDRILKLDPEARRFDSSVNATLSAELTSDALVDVDELASDVEGDEVSSSDLVTPKRQKSSCLISVMCLFGKWFLVWCLIVVFVVSAVSKPRRSGSNAGFFSRQKARIEATPLRIAGAPTSSKRARSSTPPATAGGTDKVQTPVEGFDKMEVWPKYKAYLTQDAYDHYKNWDLSDILNDAGAHAMKVSALLFVCICTLLLTHVLF